VSNQLTGPHKTAIVLLALGEKFTTEVFKRMERNEIAEVSKAMLDMESVPKETVEEVLKEYNETLAYGHEMLMGGPEQVKRILTRSLDGDTAKYIMDMLDLDSGPQPFQELENVSPRILAQILRNEHPQTLALILGHLHPDQAAELIQNLPAGVRAEVLMRLAKLEAVAEDMLMEVDKVLQNQLIAMGGKEGKKVGGVGSVAEILNAVDRATEEEVLSEIEEESSQMAEEIRLGRTQGQVLPQPVRTRRQHDPGGSGNHGAGETLRSGGRPAVHRARGPQARRRRTDHDQQRSRRCLHLMRPSRNTSPARCSWAWTRRARTR
jgi:flagellar motor switch protein FliG